MTQNNVKIAVTGGIGSGKSTVCRIIKELNYPVYSCDEIYSELLTSPAFVKRLGDEFGSDIIKNGAIQKDLLSQIVFNQGEKLKKLNSLTHPIIIEEALKKMEAHKLSFLEVPLLFENGFESLFNGVIVVLRELESRITSVIKRDNSEREKILLRIKSQFNYEKFDFSEYYVIHNNGDFNNLTTKTMEIIEKIKNLK